MKKNFSKYSFATVMLIAFILVGCKEKQAQEPNNPTTTSEGGTILPVMPVQQQSYLFDNVELIDYIFHELPFSLSQSEQPSIQAKIAGISQEAVLPNSCKSMARMFFQVKGEIVMEADVYFSPPDCYHYVFIEEGVEIYANKMGPANIQFYNHFLTQMNVTQQ